MAHQPEQVAPLPQPVPLPLVPLVPEPVVTVDVDEEDVSHLSPLVFCKILGVLWSVLFSIFGEGQGFFLSLIDGLHINIL